jgi:hypothetical protein
MPRKELGQHCLVANQTILAKKMLQKYMLTAVLQRMELHAKQTKIMGWHEVSHAIYDDNDQCMYCVAELTETHRLVMVCTYTETWTPHFASLGPEP